MAVLLRIWALVFISRILQPGECSITQAFFRKIDGKYLANHVVETKHAETEFECGMLCVVHGSCVSVNYKTSGIGKGRCELNSKTLQDTSDGDGSTSDPEHKHLHIIQKVRKERNFSNVDVTINNKFNYVLVPMQFFVYEPIFLMIRLFKGKI